MKRRNVMAAGSSLLLLSALAAGEATAREIDGDLLSAADRFMALSAEIHATDEAHTAAELAGDTARANRLDAAMMVIEHERRGLADAISGFPARTPEAMRAKAQVVRAFHGSEPPGGSIVDCVMWSLVLDLAGKPA